MSSITMLLWLVMSFDLDLVRGQEFETTNGRVRGKTVSVLGKSLDVFHGIPFAKPPIGNLRFKHPIPAEPWRPEVKDVTRETPSCIQSRHLYDLMPPGDSRRLQNDYSEDCLYLSVWKPASPTLRAKLAVMVWIYGGGFAHGSTRIPVYNGQYLAAENDVIVVSVSYRLGPLGFSYLSPDTIPGNMGLMDQVEAMKWVKRNIEYFGGDSNKITLFGQSTGAFSVGYHLMSPLSRDLFNNGILQSGVPVNSVIKGMLSTKTEAVDCLTKLSKAMGCSEITEAGIFECLKAADPVTLTTTFCNLTGVTFYPVVDGHFLPEAPIATLKRGDQKKVNIMTGITKDEITLFFSMFLDPTNMTLASTGEIFNQKHLQMSITKITGLENSSLIKALRIFYENDQSPPLDYLQILNHLGSDISLKCSAMQFGSIYSQSNEVYLYSLNHRVSTIPHPEWMGVPHSYDLDLVFGLPLNDSLGFTRDEQELSRMVMTYWSNFAKSGNPNSPVPVTATWSAFNNQNQTYMALDVGSNLATRHGFRRHQCAFVNEIVPMIPKVEENIQSVTSGHGIPCANGSRRYYTSRHVYVLGFLFMLVLIMWH